MPCNKKYPTVEGVTVYVVIDRRTRQLLYKGLSSYECAEQLEPGTCHGHGATEEEALKKACDVAERCERHERMRNAS
jgi:hypothetical protein